ncbi:MAG: glycosyltransferase [Stellaceae bacterium]
MRLLAISYMLPPALYPQAIQIGRLLARLEGHEIGAVCGRPKMAEGLDSDLDFARRLVFRLEVPFRPALSGLALNLARRFVPFYARIPDEFRSWVKLAERAVLDRLTDSGFKPDLLTSFGDPMSDHLLGLRLKRLLGLTWVAHFSDPWADDPFRRSQFLANVVNRRLERQVIAEADRVVFTSAETLDLVMAKYPPAWKAKAAVVPHSFEPGLYPPRRPHSGDLVVRYLGNFYGPRTPLPFSRARARLIDRVPGSLKDVRFELIGNLPRRFKLHPSWWRLPKGLVRHIPTVTHARSLALMAESDLLLVVDAPDEFSVFLPSKLVEYLGAGVPVFGIVPPGTSAKLITRLGGGIADPRDDEAIAAGLADALKSARQGQSSARPWGVENVRAEYRTERVAAVFMRILQEAVSPLA